MTRGVLIVVVNAVVGLGCVATAAGTNLPTRVYREPAPVGKVGPSTVVLRGKVLTGVSRVKMDARARLAVFHSSGVSGADVMELDPGFLEKWGIDRDRIAAAKAKDVVTARLGVPKTKGKLDDGGDAWSQMWFDFPAVPVGRLQRVPGGFDGQMVQMQGALGRMSETAGVPSFDLREGPDVVRVALSTYREASLRNPSFGDKIAALRALPQDFTRHLRLIGEVCRTDDGSQTYVELVDFQVQP